MECFPSVCRDKKVGAERGIGLSLVHIPLVTFVTRDGVWGFTNLASRTSFSDPVQLSPHSSVCV